MRIHNLHALPSSLLLLSASILSPTTVVAQDASVAIHTTNTDDNLTIEHTKELSCTRRTKQGDEILVHYTGTLQSNGEKFDSSLDGDAPFAFDLGAGQVIKGWDEGLIDMCVGEQRKLIIPPELGYGDRAVGPIPASSVLVFTTELMGVTGADKDEVQGHPLLEEQEQGVQADEQDELTTADIPPVDLDFDLDPDLDFSDAEDNEFPPPPPPPQEGGPEGGPVSVFAMEKNECRLLGPFALFVQAVLGLLAMLSLVFKRWRERPRRPLKIWFFDVSKQIVGTFLLHLANLAMSEFSSGGFEVLAKERHQADASATADPGGRQPNPCSFYLLNLAIDTTVGIPVLIILLKVLHVLFQRTPLANPPESIKSGHYGTPPRVSWWMKQSLIYFIGLLGMKLFVLFLFQALPWLGWVGDWALRWTEGNEALQIAFVMFIFPVCMNAIQYYIIDGVIKGKEGEGRDREGFERVSQEDSEDGGSGRSRRSSGSGSEAGVVEVLDEEEAVKKAKVAEVEDANPTPLPIYESEGSEARK